MLAQSKLESKFFSEMYITEKIPANIKLSGGNIFTYHNVY